MTLRLGPSNAGSVYNGPDSTLVPNVLGGAVDGTYGFYVASIVADQKEWTFQPGPLFQIRVYDVNAQTETDYDARNFTLMGSATSSLGVISITFEGAGALAGITIILRSYPENSGYGYGFEVTECPDTLAIMWVRYPVLIAEPFGDLADQYGALSTTVIPLPHLHTSAVEFGSLESISPGMLFAGLYDTASKACLMLWVDDVQGHGIRLKMTGLTTTVLLYVQHDFDRRYTGGELWAKTYKVHLETFTGLAADGRYCFQDIQDRFRAWAVAPARPWYRGRWYDAGSVSSRIKAAGVVFTCVLPEFSLNQTMLLRLADYLGGGEKIVARWISPDTGQTAPPTPIPNYLASSQMTDALAAVQAVGVHVTVYTLSIGWKNPQAGHFDPTNFSTFGDIRPTMIHTKTGALAADVSGFMTPDFTDPDTIDIQVAVSNALWSYISGVLNPGADHPHGNYMDAFTIDATTVEDDPTDVDWAFAANSAGVVDAIAAVRDERRIDDPDFIVITEIASGQSVGVADLVSDERPRGGTGVGNDAFGNQYVFGELIRIASLGGVGIVTDLDTEIYPGLTQEPFLLGTRQQIAMHWLTTGLVALSSGAVTDDIIASDVENGNYLGPVWSWVKKLVDAALGEGAAGFRGRRMRSLGDDFQTMLVTTSLGSTFAIALEGWEFPIQTGVQQADDGHLDIWVLHCLKAGLGSIYGTVIHGPRTVTIDLDRRRYDLSGVPKVLVRNDDGELTLLAKWTESVSVDVEVQEDSVNLFQVLEDDGRAW